jgi:hypothetical protein
MVMREFKGDQARVFEEIKEFILSGRSFHLLQGYAGTGKTHLLYDVIFFLLSQKISTIATTPTHKSLKVLKASIRQDVPFATIHSALGMREEIRDDGSSVFKANTEWMYAPAADVDFIINDEASMDGDDIFATLVQFAERGKKILFVGDACQIPPVGHLYSKPFLKEIQEEYKIQVSTLNEIIRQAQGNPIIENAYNIRMNPKTCFRIFKPQRVENSSGGVFMIPRSETECFTNIILPLYQSEWYRKNPDFVKVIGWRNEIVNRYNSIIREFIFGKNLPKIVVGDRLIADEPVVDDRKVLISANEEMEVLGVERDSEDYGEGFVINYYRVRVNVLDREDIYSQFMLRIVAEESEAVYKQMYQLQTKVAESFAKGSWQAKSAWVERKLFKEHWHKVKWSYAITAHRSQGSTYNTAYVLVWDLKTNFNDSERSRILYTAATRPSVNLYLEY